MFSHLNITRIRLEHLVRCNNGATGLFVVDSLVQYDGIYPRTCITNNSTLFGWGPGRGPLTYIDNSTK